MKDLPFMRPFAVSLPAVYESELSYYEYLNNLYNYIKLQMKPKIDELQFTCETEFPQVKTDVENLKSRMTTVVSAIEDFATRISSLETFRSNASVSIHELQVKMNTVEESVQNLSTDLTTLQESFSSFKSSTNSRLNTLESWKSIIDGWKLVIDDWKKEINTSIEIINGKIVELYDRIIKLEKGTKFITTYNFSGITLNIDSILSEEGFATWQELIGKTLTIGINFTESSTSSAGTSVLNISETDSLRLIKPETLNSVRGESLVVDLTFFRDDVHDLIFVEWKPHFSSNTSRLFGGLKSTVLNSADAIYLKLDLQGFSETTSAQAIFSIS